MAQPEPTVLTPHYYRDNFLRLCGTVEINYGDLLTDAESNLLENFRSLTFEAQCLYVRLISRVGPWFRESKLAYEELGDLAAPLDELLARGLATEAGDLSPPELGKLYTRSELNQVFSPCLDSKLYPDKGAMLEAIGALELQQGQLHTLLATLENARLIAPLGTETVELLQLLFFGNRHQSLTEFILEDLGLTQYYPYPLDKNYRLFPTRQALQEYLDCAAYSDAHYELRETGELNELPVLAREVLATNVRFSSSQNRWQRLCNSLGRDLERLQEYELASRLYQRSQGHPARERRARILERQQDWTAVKSLCEEILAQPWCEAEHEAAQRILPRVIRKLDGTPQPRPRDNFDAAELTLAKGSESVERLTAQHLQPQWQSVHYVENSLMNTLFGLAFWEQIFASVTGAFHHPYQSVPADMYDGTFRQRRAAEIEARLAQLRADNLLTILPQVYRYNAPCQCRWVDWRNIDEQLVTNAAKIIPKQHLLAIWERMLFDPGENRRGFPDLIALGKRPGDYCMIEVKGPGDTLQDSQKRWLRFFQAQDIPAQVAWVTWQDD